jgi:Ca-activated chloride channel family protein
VSKARSTNAARSPRAITPTRLAPVRGRYKAPGGDSSRQVSAVIRNRVQPMSSNLGFASAVAEFGMLLRASVHRGQASYHAVVSRARQSRGVDTEGYRAEFVRMAEMAATLGQSSR